MIQGIDNNSIISELDKTKLPTYWNIYLQYEKDEELSTLTKNALIEEIEKEKSKEKPFIDSQIVVSNLLIEFGKEHSFHRQFREKFPNSDSGQVLGMQLYHIMIQDNEIWKYLKSQKSEHLFPHSTYFK
jgi:hypothetical protein